MRFTDGSSVHVFSPQDERPHQPAPEGNWQESFVIYWYDMAQHVGGGFRLGYEPNNEGGIANSLAVIYSPEGSYHRMRAQPARPQDRTADGIGNGDDTLRYWFDGTNIRWQFDDIEVQVDITVAITTPPIDAHRQAGLGGAETILTAHIDAACHVTGTMTLKGKTYQINAFGMRDHAWGQRNLGVMRSHRWLITDMGPAESLVAMTFLTTDGQFARLGWVIRGEQVLLAKKVQVMSMIGDDGATNYGGTLQMELDNGETYRAVFEPLYEPIAISIKIIDTVLYHDCYCRVTAGDKVGFGIFETSNNTRCSNDIPVGDGTAFNKQGWNDHIRPLLTP